MTPSLPRDRALHDAVDAPEPAARVLRDVVFQGQVSPGRPRHAAVGISAPKDEAALKLAAKRSPAAGSASPSSAILPTTPPASTSPSVPGLATASAAPTAAPSGEDSGFRRGYDAGLAQGLAEGRAKAAEQARQASELASAKAQQELAERSEKMGRELTQQAQAAYQARAKVLTQLLEALPQRIEERLAAVEDDMLALSFEAVCRILGEHAATPEGLRSQLLQSVRALRGRRLVAVHLHPDDLAAVQRESAHAQVLANEDIQWIADPEILLGGCIVRSPEGGLDARLEVQLQSLGGLLQDSRSSVRPAAAEGGV